MYMKLIQLACICQMRNVFSGITGVAVTFDDPARQRGRANCNSSAVCTQSGVKINPELNGQMNALRS